MKRNIAYKFLLSPSDEQIVRFSKTFGCCRKVYNLMLEEKRANLLSGGKCGKVTPARYKKRFPYLKEVDSLALANEQLNLEQAFSNYFKNKKFGFPKFKSNQILHEILGKERYILKIIRSKVKVLVIS